jgi:hypothetical protein
MNVRDIYKPTPFVSETSCDLKHFLAMLDYDNVDFDPPYQRGVVWTLDQQEQFMGHLISGGEVLPLVFQRVPDMGNAEILDGKQRATSIVRWLKGEIGARLFDGRNIHVSDITAGLGIVEIRIKYVNLPFEERKKFYVKLNSAGTPHTVELLQAALLAKPKKGR